MRKVEEVLKTIQDFAEAQLKDAYTRCDILDSDTETDTLMSEDGDGNQIYIGIKLVKANPVDTKAKKAPKK